MRKTRRWLRPVVVAGALLSLPTLGSAGPASFPVLDEHRLSGFTAALERDGFDVNAGAAGVINLVAAWCAGTPLPGFDHALYSNNQPYLLLRVPRSAQEPEQQTTVFQLGREEAIVLIGLTPPPERYFGFYPFLRTKVGPDGTRRPLWATLGDAVNNASVSTIGSSPFNAPVALIFTPDQGTDARVRTALRAAGYPAAIFNTVVVPASMLDLGHGDAADELMIAVRNSMWQTPSEGDAYILEPPLRVFRVTPREETMGSPFPAPPLRVRGTGRTEMELMKDLDLLRQRILAANPGLHAGDIVPRPNWYEGYDYIQRGLDPWGDSRDSFYLSAGYLPEFGSLDRITLADDEFLVVYGANHVATGKASYASLNVYSGNEGKVPIGGLDDRMFPGAAAGFLADRPDAARLLYAYKISRRCGSEPHCVTLAIDDCPRLTIGPDTALGLIFRAYLEPATRVGPAMPEILYDRVIKFSPRAP